MKKLESCLTSIELNIKNIVISGIIWGIIPGLLMVPDILTDTSFQDIGANYEFWIFAALLIIINSKTPKESAIYTFLFFLISQPLIYLVQVPFNSFSFDIFKYYPLWGKLTLLTLPGAYIGWYVKKDNLLSVLLFSVVNFLLCVTIPFYVIRFPYHIISTVFILWEIAFFINLLFKNKRNIILAILLSILMTGTGIYFVL